MGRMILVYLTKAFSPSILECNSLLIAISLLTVDIISQNPPFFNTSRLFSALKQKNKPIKSTYMCYSQSFSWTLLVLSFLLVRRKLALVRMKGLEPPRRWHWFLRPARLPVPPHPHFLLTILIIAHLYFYCQAILKFLFIKIK